MSTRRINIVKGYEHNKKAKRLKALEPVLRKWPNIIERYCNMCEDDAGECLDVPYWFNERANIGILNVAAWQVKWIGLEEYSTEKFDDKGKKKKSGRTDLYLANEDDEEFCFEAKQLWFSLTAPKNKIVEMVNRKFKAAKKGAKRMMRYEGDRIALVFATPRIHKKYIENINNEISNVIELINDKIDYDVFAWSFPKNTRKVFSPKYAYPGIFLIARTLRRIK